MNGQVLKLRRLVKDPNTIVAIRNNIVHLIKQTKVVKNYCTVLSLTVSFKNLSASCGISKQPNPKGQGRPRSKHKNARVKV